MGFRCCWGEGRPSTDGERINECGRRRANEWGTNQRMRTTEGGADRGRWTVDGGGRPSTNRERINEWWTAGWTADCRPLTAGWTMDGGCRPSTNGERRIETADGRLQTTVAQAFQTARRKSLPAGHHGWCGVSSRNPCTRRLSSSRA